MIIIGVVSLRNEKKKKSAHTLLQLIIYECR